MGDPYIHEFFRLLSLCHTVMSEEKNEGKLQSWLCALPYLTQVFKLGYCSALWLAGGSWVGHVTERVATYITCVLPPTQGSCTTKPSPRTRGPWSLQPGTLVLYSVLVLPRPSLFMRWAQPSPTSCWPSWTSTIYESGCRL